MGRLILIVLLGSIGVYGLVSFNMNSSSTQASSNAVDYYKDINARNIANSVVSMLVSSLSEDSNFRVLAPLTINLFEGTAQYRMIDTILATDSLVKIDVTGYHLGSSKRVNAFIKLMPSPDVPPFFKYALLGGTEVIINGNNSSVVDDNNPTINANVHSNDKIILNGNSTLIEGFATYTGSITANWHQVTITPNQNPSSLPVHSNSTALAIPAFNPTDYLSEATQVYYGDKTFSGNVTLGTKENPEIIYISGKLFIQGTFSGYGIFIVKDDVEVTGNVLVANPIPSTSSIGIYTEKKFIVNGANRIIYAQVFANDDIILNNNNISLYGSITSRKKVILNGNYANIFYKPASGYLTNPFWPTSITADIKPVIVHYFE